MRYKGYEYLVILQPGGYLTAYVKLPKTHKYYDKHYDKMRKLAVHGGVTFAEMIEENEKHWTKGFWIGWDYAHAGDAMPGMNLMSGNSKDHIWQPSEAIEHCKDAIRQLIEIK